jgi:hypothetical protein
MACPELLKAIDVCNPRERWGTDKRPPWTDGRILCHVCGEAHPCVRADGQEQDEASAAAAMDRLLEETHAGREG